ncbi:SAM-dependent methyltransferase [Kitasatospora sp. NPDC004723]|uniref:SAM-dependent methyltransferase n=1 Tax=Kitasatospora sp. NPDC004723 TaxID=3154288 RepID=UPI0033B3B72A
MSESAPAQRPIDVTVPSAARMYDFLLGGNSNFASDRLAVEELLVTAPNSRELAVNNRAFLRRVVRTIVAEYGIDQIIDHGSGLPTQDNVHQVAQRVNANCRVAYVDNDPVVLTHARALLDENENVAVIDADMADTDRLLTDRRLRMLIDLKRPVAALFVSVLHCVDDEKAAAMVRETLWRLAPGSVVVICQLVSDDPEVRRKVTALMDEQTHGQWGRVRTAREVDAYFEGLDVQPPGLGDVSLWRPDHEVLPRQRTQEWTEYGGLALVPPAPGTA